jgi:SAM-dependent methyltransferase
VNNAKTRDGYDSDRTRSLKRTSSSSLSSGRRLGRSSRAMTSLIITSSTSSSTPSSTPSSTSSSAGVLKRAEVIDRNERRKLNEQNDRLWYAKPRFCAHVDDNFLEQLMRLYRQRTQREMKALDLCSSHLSHYPFEYEYTLGHGLNEEELKRNKEFKGNFFVRNFNEMPKIDAADQSFDFVSMCVSVQYMTRAEELFAEIFRVLKPGGVVIVSYSNRMFYEKALAVWRDGTGFSRTQLVKSYFTNVTGFTEPEVITEVLDDGVEDEKNAFVKLFKTFVKRSSGDPFYAVVAYRNFKRINE